MKAFLDKYKYILGLGLALAAVVIIAVVSAVAGKDTAENSGISYSMPETSAVTSTASLDTTSAPKTSVNSNAPPATTVTGTSSQASSKTASQSHSQAATSSKKTETATASAPETPVSETPATAVPTASATTKKPSTATSTTVTAATTKATTKATATVTSPTRSTDKITTPKPDEKPIVQYAHSCTFTIDCKTILDNRDMLKKGLEKYVPDDGMIYSGTVGFDSGESVYDILRRICDENKIQMEASFTPAFGSYYVEGINNLYELDCGKRSGWMYCVNGVFPNYGCSSYFPVNGDIIAFRYTCELGFDLKN